MTKKKVLVFHQSLAPYRIDLWNRMNELFDFTIYFMYDNLLNQKFDQEALKKQISFEPRYISKGFNAGNRAVRWGFASIIRKVKPDIVISYEYSQTTLMLHLVRKLNGFRYRLLTMSDDSLAIAESCSGMRRIFRQYLASRIDGVILIDSEVALYHEQKLQLDKKTIVLPILAREERFREGLSEALELSKNYLNDKKLIGKKCVFYVGRLVDVKGIDRLITAFSKACKQHPDSMLVLIGDGDKRPELDQQASSAGISDRVLFAGRYEGRALYAWFNLMPVMALASHYEPFGAVVNEALLSGAEVLCSTYAGARNLITPGINGDHFDPYDIDRLSSLIDTQLSKMQPLHQIETIRPSRMQASFQDSVDNLQAKLNQL